MQVTYRTRALERVCTDDRVARKEYGNNMAHLIHRRVRQLRSAGSTEYLLRFHVGRCHALKGQREGQYAMLGLPTMLDLVHPYRLVFEKLGDMIHIVRIVEIVDYH